MPNKLEDAFKEVFEQQYGEEEAERLAKLAAGDFDPPASNLEEVFAYFYFKEGHSLETAERLAKIAAEGR